MLIRTATDGDRNSSYLLDMTPNTVPTFDMTDAALLPGQAFVDSAAGVTITLTGRDAAQATVNVTLGAPSGCIRSNPTITVSAAAAAVAPGTALNYSTSVTNNDNAGCGASTLNLQSTLLAGWSGSFANPALSLMPGAAASTTSRSRRPARLWAATRSAWAPPIARALPTAHRQAPATPSPVRSRTAVATDKAVYRRNESVTMSASVRSGANPVANASVAFTIIKPNGATVVRRPPPTRRAWPARATACRARTLPGPGRVRNNASYQGSSASAQGGFTVQ